MGWLGASAHVLTLERWPEPQLELLFHIDQVYDTEIKDVRYTISDGGSDVKSTQKEAEALCTSAIDTFEQTHVKESYSAHSIPVKNLEREGRGWDEQALLAFFSEWAAEGD